MPATLGSDRLCLFLRRFPYRSRTAGDFGDSVPSEVVEKLDAIRRGYTHIDTFGEINGKQNQIYEQ